MSESKADVVSHYKRKLLRHVDDCSPEVVLHCLNKLDQVAVNTSILKKTGIGKIVNQLKRSSTVDDEVKAQARKIVDKWKIVVANDVEEEDEEEEEDDEDEEDVDQPEPDHVTQSDDAEEKSEAREEDEEDIEGPDGPPVLEPEVKRKEARKRDKERHKDRHKERHKKKKDKDKDKEKDKHHRHHHHHHGKDVEKKSSKKESSSSSSSLSTSKASTSSSFEAALQKSSVSNAAQKKRSSASINSSISSSISSSVSANVIANVSTNVSANVSASTSSGSSSNGHNVVQIPSDISPHYNPRLPAAGSSSRPAVMNGKTDDEALSALIMKSKSFRPTAVYSGTKRSAFGEKVPSLFDLCIHVLQENVHDIGECGNLPFDILQPVLERAKAGDLMRIEDLNPYLMESTGELWERHCRKHFLKERRQEYESWREMFERCTEERQEKLDLLKEKVQQSYRTEKESHRMTKLAYVDGVQRPRGLLKRVHDKNGVFPASASRVPCKKPGRDSAVGASSSATIVPAAAKKPKVAPMMAKTLKMARGLKTGFRR